MNDISSTIFYNQRLIISAPIPEPVAWRVTKVEDVSPKGIRRLTFAQDIWDQHKDYIERDIDGNVVGMYADYYISNINPEMYSPDKDQPISSSTVTSTITCSGKPQFKIGGSAKTFTVTYYDENNEVIQDHEPGIWRFFIDHQRVPEELLTLSEDGVKIKVKFLGDDSYIGKILTVTNAQADATASMQVEIIAL